ncbi:hypothetical protein NDU88_006427 [Pleurodeles waltl]|uniref:Uncharacterized protein n=1 Tax=Pleurodeles waltl TaxID=8319 RepID=A0AAV7PLR7_PLEWA|nr:hypothetical protein NDU88_006427 [Pleurodeles waltl]
MFPRDFPSFFCNVGLLRGLRPGAINKEEAWLGAVGKQLRERRSPVLKGSSRKGPHPASPTGEKAPRVA